MVTDGFWMERDLDAKIFSYSVHDVTCNPEFVTNGDASAWPNLILELAGCDLDVGATDGDACIKTGAIVCFEDVSAEYFTSTYTTIVFTLKYRFLDDVIKKKEQIYFCGDVF
jgi:hypothetical protein